MSKCNAYGPQARTFVVLLTLGVGWGVRWGDDGGVVLFYVRCPTREQGYCITTFFVFVCFFCIEMDHKTRDPYSEPRPADVSLEEWTVRVQLAQCYHLVDYFGWTETIFNHISARVPGTNTYLVNPFGLSYFEVTPSNLLKVDLDGNKLSPSPYDPNPAGFALHSAIHGARHDISCVIHTHTTPVSAVALKEAGYTLESGLGYGRVIIDVGFNMMASTVLNSMAA